MINILKQDDILTLGINLFQFIGEFTNNKKRTMCFIRTLNSVIMTVILFFTVANIFHSEGDMYLKTLESATTIIHALLKYLLFLFYKSDIDELLRDTLKFWDHRNFEEEICEEVTTLIKIIKVAQKYLLCSFCAAVHMYFLKPYFNRSNRFVFHSWIFIDSLILDTVVLIFQYYFLLIITSVVLGYDIIYFSLCAHLVIQLRLVKCNIINIKNSEVHKLCTSIKHHQLLLSIFYRMGRIYSLMLLFHYFVTLTTTCSQMYVILLGQISTIDLFAALVYGATLFLQFGFYTLPVEEVVFELSDLSNAIYSSTWYDNDLSIQKLLLIIMQKTQHRKYFSGGGMMDINADAFGSVVRKTFSFYAILKNILN